MVHVTKMAADTSKRCSWIPLPLPVREMHMHARAKMEKQGASSVLVTSAHPAVPGHGGPESKAIRGLRNLKTSKHKQTTNLALGANAMDHELGPRGNPPQTKKLAR